MCISGTCGKEVAMAVVRAIQEKKDYLSEVDGLIGDGDHGINMNKGVTLFAGKVEDREKVDIAEAFKLLGRTLLSDIGGSMGPIYGTFFMEMAKQAKDQNSINAEQFGQMLSAALEGIRQLGGAQVGDKTLIDCLEPAVTAFQDSNWEGRSFEQSLLEMKEAAEKGRDSTKDLRARLGRASRLGERSRGVLDAGAVSCCIILEAMADEITAQLNKADCER